MVGGVTGPAAEVCALAGRTHLADQIRLHGVIRLAGRYGDRSRPGEPVKQTAWAVRLGERPRSGQSHGNGVQGQPHAGSDHRAVDADVLQIGPEEQFQLARCLRRVPALDCPRD